MKPTSSVMALLGKQKGAAPLLPPLALYRRILRAHRTHLPADFRQLGDQYVKHEFQQHRSTDNPLYIVGFLTSWQDYWHQLVNDSWNEGSLTKEQLEKMSSDQQLQLYLLMKETQSVAKNEKYEDSEDPVLQEALKKK